MSESAWVLLAGFLLDLIMGDPVYRLHPVRCIGMAARLWEAFLRRIRLNGLWGGAVFVILMLATAGCFGLGLWGVCRSLHPWLGFAVAVYLTTSCLALRDLLAHVRPVAQALCERDLPDARRAVQRIVGRDTEVLDTQGIARAAIETVSENFVDSVLAPLCWYALGAWLWRESIPLTGALMALLMYRTVNTLDAMVGYRNERYLRFGRGAARLDDAMNFFPARISIPLLCLSAALCGLDACRAWSTALRDRRKHPSPNAGHPESCLAGALDIRLGGPTVYTHGTVDKPWLGEGDGEVTAEHIDQACRVVNIAGLLSIIFILLAMVCPLIIQT